MGNSFLTDFLTAKGTDIEAYKNCIAVSPREDKACFILGVPNIYLKDDPLAIVECNFLNHTHPSYAHQPITFLKKESVMSLATHEATFRTDTRNPPALTIESFVRRQG